MNSFTIILHCNYDKYDFNLPIFHYIQKNHSLKLIQNYENQNEMKQTRKIFSFIKISI